MYSIHLEHQPTCQITFACNSITKYRSTIYNDYWTKQYPLNTHSTYMYSLLPSIISTRLHIHVTDKFPWTPCKSIKMYLYGATHTDLQYSNHPTHSLAECVAMAPPILAPVTGGWGHVTTSTTHSQPKHCTTVSIQYATGSLLACLAVSKTA